MLAVSLSGPTLHDEALTMIELSGNAYSPWPTAGVNSGELRRHMLYTPADLPTVLRNIGQYDRHPPLYYVCLWLWTQIAPHQLLAYRLLSAIFWLLTLIIVAKWTRSAWCCILLALNPDAFGLGSIARDYSLAVLCIVLTAWVLDPTTKIKPKLLFLASISGALAVWTHFLAVVPVGILFLCAAYRNWRKQRWQTACSVVLFGALIGPALLMAHSQMSTATQTVFAGWGPESYKITRALLRFPSNPGQFLPTSLDWIASAIVAITFLVAGFRFTKASERARIALLIVFGDAAFLAALSAISRQDLSAVRYLELTLPFCYILFAEFAKNKAWGGAIAAACAILLAMGCVTSIRQSRRIIAARDAIFAKPGNKLVIVDGKEIPGMPGAILNDVPEESRFYVLQSADQVKSATALASTSRTAVYCPSARESVPGQFSSLAEKFPREPLRIFMGYDCYVRFNH